MSRSFANTPHKRENKTLKEYRELTKNETKTEYNIDGKLNIKVSKTELKRGLKEKLSNKHETAFIYQYCLNIKEQQKPN